MKITEQKRYAIVRYFVYYKMVMADIAKIYNVTPPRIRQILIEKLGEKKFKEIRKQKMKENNVYLKYHNDEAFRLEYINKVKLRKKKNDIRNKSK